MGRLIESHGDLWRTSRASHFEILARILVGQQISVKAAATIHGRLQAACGGRVTARALRKLDEATLRTCGLSRQKRAGLSDLAARVSDGSLRPDQLWRMHDEDVRGAVTQVRGLGPWSAEIFLMFGLGRPDLLPTDDQGLRAAFTHHLGARRAVSVERMLRAARPWRPWRTLACLYLWASLDNSPNERNSR
jgi:DNA-3-methyladenine glycosylase II